MTLRKATFQDLFGNINSINNINDNINDNINSMVFVKNQKDFGEKKFIKP